MAWLRAVLWAGMLLAAGLLSGSCSHYSPIYWGWGEWTGPGTAGGMTDSVALLDWSTLPGVVSSVDGAALGAGYRGARLCAGRHVIEYAYRPVEFGTHPQGTIELDLEPGHRYAFRLKLCFWCMPRRHAVWVDDRTAGRVVWGKRNDWPWWFL